MHICCSNASQLNIRFCNFVVLVVLHYICCINYMLCLTTTILCCAWILFASKLKYFRWLQWKQAWLFFLWKKKASNSGKLNPPSTGNLDKTQTPPKSNSPDLSPPAKDGETPSASPEPESANKLDF